MNEIYIVIFDSISEAFESAKNSNCPCRLSGAARRKYTNLQKKNAAELTEYEKKFQEYAEYCKKARNEYFKEKKRTQGLSMSETQGEPKKHQETEVQEDSKSENQEKPKTEIHENLKSEVQDEEENPMETSEVNSI